MDVIIGVIFAACLLTLLAWDKRRKQRRRKTLRQTQDGGWVWTDFDGSERQSDIHPDEPGGDWYSEADADGDDGDGGDGGGD